MKINKKDMGGGVNKMDKNMYKTGGLTEAQKKMDRNNNNKIDSEDLAMLRKAKHGMKMEYGHGGKNKMMYEDGGVPLKKKTIPQEGSEMPKEEMAKDEQAVDQKERQVQMYMKNMGDFAKQYPAQFEAVLKDMMEMMQEMGNEMREENMRADDPMPGEFDPSAMQEKPQGVNTTRRPRFIE